jgi:hypothetical protein
MNNALKIALVGEGPSDLGTVDLSNTFKEGPLFVLARKIIQSKCKYDKFEVLLYTRSRIKDIRDSSKTKKLMCIPKKDRKKGVLDLSETSKILGQQAKNENCGLAIVFHDADGVSRTPKHNLKSIIESIEYGFTVAEFDKGVAMVPQPISEAWLLCASRKYAKCNRIELLNGSSSSADNPKALLSNELKNTSTEALIAFAETIDVNIIDMDSFNIFKTELLRKI